MIIKILGLFLLILPGIQIWSKLIIFLFLLGKLYKDFYDLFQSDMFHMGGDEINLNCWNTSTEIRCSIIVRNRGIWKWICTNTMEGGVIVNCSDTINLYKQSPIWSIQYFWSFLLNHDWLVETLSIQFFQLKTSIYRRSNFIYTLQGM